MHLHLTALEAMTLLLLLLMMIMMMLFGAPVLHLCIEVHVLRTTTAGHLLTTVSYCTV
jgi:hypothetical protein